LFPGLTEALRRNSASSVSPGGVRTTLVKDSSRKTVRVHRLEGPDPGYAGGAVVSKADEGVVLKSDAGVRAVRIPSGSRVWKEFDVTIAEIEIGDWVDAKGTPQADGSLLADSGRVFVNIGRRDGKVQVVSAGQVSIETAKGSVQSLELSPRLEVLDLQSGAVSTRGIADIQSGMQIGAVGLRLPGGGFRATRIWH
jgi:hypothetical protein